MTGPEHYLAAEACVALALDAEPDSAVERSNLAEAKVHAELALVAAVALQVTATQPPHITDAGADWRKVLTPADRADATS